MTRHKVYDMRFGSVYPAYVAKAERKGRTATVSTPIFHEGHVFVSSAYGVGCNGFKISYNDKISKSKEFTRCKSIYSYHYFYLARCY